MKMEEKLYVIKSSLSPEQFIIIASEDMQRILARAINPFQTDSIEGFIESYYFKGEMNVTVTSTRCPDRNTQIPVLISVLMNKDTQAYQIHLKRFFKIYGAKYTTIDELILNFPGNTSDFADAIKNGFFLALDTYCLKKYKQKLNTKEKTLMFRYCDVHFERNLCRVASISKSVDRDRVEEFKDHARNLIRYEILVHSAKKLSGC